MPIEEHEGGSAAEEKKHKKKHKKEKKSKEAQEEAQEAQEEVVDMEVDEKKKKKKEKKDKKEKRKREDEDEEAAAPVDGEVKEEPAKEEAEEEEEAEGEKKKKKDKKEKKEKKAKHEHKEAAAAPAAGKGGVQKHFYNEHAKVKAMSDAEVNKFHQESRISVEGASKRYNPILSFEHASMPADIMKACSTFKTPSFIQSQCWPVALSGEDLIGIAATGSGKTIAFGLPGLVHVKARGRPTPGKPFMLVLAPTRELAMQIDDVLLKAGANCTPPVKTVCVYGGVPKHEQRSLLKAGVHVVVATPGRLLDLMEEGNCDLSDVSFAVLDEADRMLDMGFERDIKKLLGATRADRQTLMFSATWPVEVQKIAASYQKNPVRVIVGSDEAEANVNVQQIVEVMEPEEKNRRLLALLQQHHSSRKNRILVFVLYKAEAVRVESLLQQKGYNVMAIHGDLSQEKRGDVLDQFRSGKVPLMIATDVAARGLDVKGIEYVINYTFPLTIEDYIHRIGRTGRAGAKGVAYTFFTLHDKAHAGELGNVLRGANIEVPEALMKFGQHVKRKKHPVYGDHFRTTDDLVNAQPTKITFSDSDD